MRRLIPLLVMLGVAASPALAQSYYMSPDVPTDLGGTTYLPWQVVRVDAGVYSLPPGISHPLNTAVDSLHAMCSGDWLLSVEATAELPPGSGGFWEPWDVFRFDGTNYFTFFCGGVIGLPPGTDVDAAFLRGGDSADLVISFDVTTDLTGLGGLVYEPADLVQWQRTGPNCWDWSIVFVAPSGPFFDASAATPPVPTSANVTGADRRLGRVMFPFDVPTTLAATYLPGQIVAWDASIPGFVPFDSPPWPVNRSSRQDAFTFPPDPGEVPSMHVDKSSLVIGNILVTWTASTSAGAEDYAVYEGTVGSWYSHSPAPTAVSCTDTGSDLQEDFTPSSGDRYYLVVAMNPDLEGSYGRRTGGAERPQLSGSCRSGQGFDCP